MGKFWQLLGFGYLLVSFHLSAGEIHQLANRGDIHQVKLLLAKNPKLVNSRDEFGWTPLHFCALRGHKKLSILLINRGANVNAKDRYGLTALDFAGLQKFPDIVELLLSRGAEINPKEQILESAPKLLPVLGFRKELVELFNKQNQNIKNQKISFNPNQLILAVMKIRENLSGQRISKGIKPQSLVSSKFFPLLNAAKIGNLEKVVSILRVNPELINASDEYGITALHFSTINGHHRISEIL